jgi:rod shape-determining protein MreC
MFRLLERYQTFIVLFFIVTVPLLVYRANSRTPADANIVDRLVLAATAPIKSMINAAVGGVSDTWYDYVDVVGARAENGELRRRANVAENERDRLKLMEEENLRFRKLLLIKDTNPKHEPLAANVIAVGTSPLSRTIEIDVGAIDGVQRGMAVIAEDGLVGLVMRVGWTSCEVILIADEKMMLWARVVRSRARGRVHGSGSGPGFRLELSEVLRSDDITVGDRVATSGLGGVFPGGIPIGEVTEVRTPTGAQHRVADVEPYVDFARLDHVSVLVGRWGEDDPLVMPDPLRPAVLRTGAPNRVELAVDAGVPGTPDAGVRDAGGRARPDSGARYADAGVRDARPIEARPVKTETSTPAAPVLTSSVSRADGG